ncbi:uncharacterized protein LOC119097514 [Pollicipes pollicipes]|uniref:uncharacterized protein LOC119097512 n=1 Tax=Pollicipes pollicipes TaxID=41117 RepID=UPI0018856BFC|nr:uncharacterized protein LOC119097512 [Pollicipes pollicipes]XP_037076442.1 uncharacterized protein LOC119097514 [Pollicipes pollicipes]
MDEADDAEETLACYERDFTVLEKVTGTVRVEDVVKIFETQGATEEHLKAFANELEAKKVALLNKLRMLGNVSAASVYKVRTENDDMLRTASGDCKAALAAASEHRWSQVAANNRVTQALARLRQLLEYLVEAFISDGVITPPELPDANVTERYLTALLEAAGRGVADLMAGLGDETGRAQRAAAAVQFVMTPAEKRQRRVRASLASSPGADELTCSVGFDEGDTTGDDASVPSREVIKRQAQLLLQAKQKSGGSRRRKT